PEGSARRLRSAPAAATTASSSRSAGRSSPGSASPAASSGSRWRPPRHHAKGPGAQAARVAPPLPRPSSRPPAAAAEAGGPDAAALDVARRLRAAGLRVELDGGRSLKSMMRRADKLGAPRVLILGDEELAKRRGTLRDMRAQRDEKLAVDLDLTGDALLAAV